MKVTLLFVSILVGCLSGCATVEPPRPVDPVEQGIKGLAEGIQKLMSEMVALDRYRTGLPETKPVTELLASNHPLQSHATSVMQGDVRQVLRRLCDDSNMGLLVTGRAATALVVYTNMRDQPLAKILENVGSQLGSTAEIRYRQSENQIELRYKN